MEIKVNVKKTAIAKTLKFSCKVSDMFSGHIYDENNREIGGQDYGYVPRFMPGRGGDYVVMEIDLETGKINNWEQPTAEQLEAFVNGNDEG